MEYEAGPKTHSYLCENWVKCGLIDPMFPFVKIQTRKMKINQTKTMYTHELLILVNCGCCIMHPIETMFSLLRQDMNYLNSYFHFKSIVQVELHQFSSIGGFHKQIPHGPTKDICIENSSQLFNTFIYMPT